MNLTLPKLGSLDPGGDGPEHPASVDGLWACDATGADMLYQVAGIFIRMRRFPSELWFILATCCGSKAEKDRRLPYVELYLHPLNTAPHVIIALDASNNAYNPKAVWYPPSLAATGNTPCPPSQFLPAFPKPHHQCPYPAASCPTGCSDKYGFYAVNYGFFDPGNPTAKYPRAKPVHVLHGGGADEAAAEALALLPRQYKGVLQAGLAAAGPKDHPPIPQRRLPAPRTPFLGVLILAGRRDAGQPAAPFSGYLGS